MHVETPQIHQNGPVRALSCVTLRYAALRTKLASFAEFYRIFIIVVQNRAVPAGDQIIWSRRVFDEEI